MAEEPRTRKPSGQAPRRPRGTGHSAGAFTIKPLLVDKGARLLPAAGSPKLPHLSCPGRALLGRRGRSETDRPVLSIVWIPIERRRLSIAKRIGDLPVYTDQPGIA